MRRAIDKVRIVAVAMAIGASFVADAVKRALTQ